MTGNFTHFPISTTGSIAVNRIGSSNLLCSRITNILRIMDVAEQNCLWLNLHNPLQQRTVAALFLQIIVAVGHIQDTHGGAVANHNISIVGDALPNSAYLCARLHKGPVAKSWRIWTPPNLQTHDFSCLVIEILDTKRADILSSNKSALDAGVMVTAYQHFVRDIQLAIPIEKVVSLGLVSRWVPVVCEVAAVDHQVDVIRDIKLFVIGVSITDVPNNHGKLYFI